MSAPVTGLMPAASAALWNLTSANRLLWSVIATAGWPRATQRPTSSGMRMVESTSEYSLCRWRWTKLAGMPSRSGGRRRGIAAAYPPNVWGTRLDTTPDGARGSADVEQLARLGIVAGVSALVDALQVPPLGGFGKALAQRRVVHVRILFLEQELEQHGGRGNLNMLYKER